MPQILIKNGNIILKDRILKNSSLSIDKAKIINIGRCKTTGKPSMTIDAKGCFVSAGFIDSHIHGSPGDIFRNEVRFGTTAIVPAISCDKLERIYKKINKAEDFMTDDPLGRNLLGIRLEGPYINKEKAGAQNKTYIRMPDKKELLKIIKKCGPALKIMTIAPEMNGAAELIRMLKRSAVIPSIGHSNATFKEALKGFDAGITHATHLFNAMSKPDEESPGATSAAMVDERITTEIILDRIHVPIKRLVTLALFKDKGKIVLVTDSVRAERSLTALKRGLVYRKRDGVIVGSSLTMIGAVRNAVVSCGLSLVDAVRFATANPAALLRMQKKKGMIAPGKDADIVIFDKGFNVKLTMISGRIIYRKRGF